MRAPVVILLLLVLAAAAWLWSGRGDDAPALPTAPVEAPKPGPGPTAPAEHGERVPSPSPALPPPPADPAPPPDTPPPAPAAPPNVVLVVRGLATRAPVATFRWRFHNSRGAARGEGTDGRAELALEPAAVGDLLVEAEGFAPWTRTGVVVPEPPAPPLQVDVFLGPAVPAAGITLFVRDLSLQPVTNVRVDAFALATATAPSAPMAGSAPAWHLGAPLWARRTGTPDGRYVLPQLPPGEHGIRVVATDADGALLPLLPYRATFTLTGDNGFVEDVALAPGALLALELVDAGGAPLDPTRTGTTLLQLTLPGGPPVARKWSVRSGGADASAIDALPGVGKVALAEAVDAGQYLLEVRIGGVARVQRHLFLRPGVTTEERVVVP